MGKHRDEGLPFEVVVVVIGMFGMWFCIQDLFRAIGLEPSLGWSLLGWLFVTWLFVGLWGVSFFASWLRHTWPFGLAFTWLVLMPAFEVWLPREWFAIINSWWAEIVAFAAIIYGGYRINPR